MVSTMWRTNRALLITATIAVFVEVGECIRPPWKLVNSVPTLIGRDGDQQQGTREKSASGFIGPFRPSEAELRLYREIVLGFGDSSQANTNGTIVCEEGKIAVSSGLLSRLNPKRLSRALRAARDGGSRTIWSAAEKSLLLGMKGGIWLRKRWRIKIVYCLLGVYGVRVAGRVINKIKTSLLASSDVLLDAEDRELASRGAIFDVEGQALLIRLQACHSGFDKEKGDCGWGALESSVRRALGLRCVVGKRGRYADELADALRGLEQARDEADMNSLGSERCCLVGDAVVLTQARLCDACLRSLRDGLILASADLSALSTFWNDQKSNDRRMGLIKSFVLGTLLHGKVSGKRVAVERDQEKMSASDLLLERYLRRLGGVQSHLQSRPKASLRTTGGRSGATLTANEVESLEEWIDDGMYLVQQALEDAEAPGLSLHDSATAYGSVERVAHTLHNDSEERAHHSVRRDSGDTDKPSSPDDTSGSASLCIRSLRGGLAFASQADSEVFAHIARLNNGTANSSASSSITKAANDAFLSKDAVSSKDAADVRGGGRTPFAGGNGRSRSVGSIPVVVLLPSWNKISSSSEEESITACVRKFSPSRACSKNRELDATARHSDIKWRRLSSKVGRATPKTCFRSAPSEDSVATCAAGGCGSLGHWISPTPCLMTKAIARRDAEEGLGKSRTDSSDCVKARRCSGSDRTPDNHARCRSSSSKEGLAATMRGGGTRGVRADEAAAAAVAAASEGNRSVEATVATGGAMASSPSSFMSPMPKTAGVKGKGRTREQQEEAGSRSRWAESTMDHSSTSVRRHRNEQERTRRKNRSNTREAAGGDSRDELASEIPHGQGLDSGRKIKEVGDGWKVAGKRGAADEEELGEWNVVSSDTGASETGVLPGGGGVLRVAGHCVEICCRSVGMGVSTIWGGITGAAYVVSLTAVNLIWFALFLPAPPAIRQRKRKASGDTAVAGDDARAIAAPRKYAGISPFPLVDENSTTSPPTKDRGIASRVGDASEGSKSRTKAAGRTVVPGNSTIAIYDPTTTKGNAHQEGTEDDRLPRQVEGTESDRRWWGKKTAIDNPRATAGNRFFSSWRATTYSAASDRSSSPSRTTTPGTLYDCARDPPAPGSSTSPPLGIPLPETLTPWMAILSPTHAPPVHNPALQCIVVPVDLADLTRILTDATSNRNLSAPWELSAPAEGVPRESGRRSRVLVRIATRAAKLTPVAAAHSAAGIAGGTAGGRGGGEGRGGGAGLARALRARAAEEVVEIGAARPPPRKVLRRVVGLAVCIPTGLRSGRYVRDNWNELIGVGLQAKTGLSSFFTEQLKEPCQAVLKNIFFRERSNLMDQAALEDAETSLKNMLRDFLEDSKIVPEHLREEAVSAADMSVVSRQLEMTTRRTIRGTLNGKIPRMLLIQVAFLKKELLQAMQAIDELFQANQVTLKLISVVPAALLIAVASRLSLMVVQSATSRRLEPTVLVHRSMRATVREMERLLTSSRGFVGAQELALQFIIDQPITARQETLNLEDSPNRVIPNDKDLDSELGPGGSVEKEREDPGLRRVTGGGSGNILGMKGWERGQHGSVSDAGGVSRRVVERGAGALSVEELAERSMLSQEETGKLALCIHGLQTILRQNHARFESRSRRKLEQDLHDLTRGRPTVPQQIAIVTRMQRSYAFLRPEGA